MSSERLLLICGPTGTGKTVLGLELAKQFNGEIISADSRQVYKYMDVVTGKDLPVNSKTQSSKIKIDNRYIPFYDVGGVKLWGYDLVRPDEEWSVKLFRDFADTVITDVRQREKLAIVVGGTGMYLKSLTESMPLISIPRNEALRKDLKKTPAQNLYALLEAADLDKALSMNNSDRQNPRRLIRALEVVRARHAAPHVTSASPLLPPNALWIGLTCARDQLYEQINQRVDKRVGPLLFRELEMLSKKHYLRHAPSQTIGYQQWIEHIDGEITREGAIQRWKLAERAYSRRQVTWFKKQTQIQWFDISTPKVTQDIVSRVRQWYDENDARLTTS